MSASSGALKPGDPAYAGQKHYSERFLKIYNPLVLGFFGRVVWRCPTWALVQHHRRHIRARHLDVGPGTAYFLERAHLPEHATVTLLDPNPDVLVHASRRLRHLGVSAVQADVGKALPVDQRFESAALNYVLHCLPGPMSAKAQAIANVAAVLESDGVLFGATVLGTPELHTWLSRPLLDNNNRQGIFDNLSDTEEGLRDVLGASFYVVDLEVVGAVAVFAATTPRSPA